MATAEQRFPSPIDELIGRLPGHLRREVLAALSAELESPRTMTFAEFLEWCDEDTHAEWVNGSVIMASPASVKHQIIAGFMYAVLRHYVERHALGLVLPPPLLMKLGHASREPDVLFVSTEHMHRFKDTYLDGPADLVVEVISPDSGGRDRGDKFYEYREAGIREYWLIDPSLHEAEFYRLDAEGRYRLMSLEAGGIYRSEIVRGFWLRMDWLWQHPYPNALAALRELDPTIV